MRTSWPESRNLNERASAGFESLCVSSLRSRSIGVLPLKRPFVTALQAPRRRDDGRLHFMQTTLYNGTSETVITAGSRSLLPSKRQAKSLL